MMKTCAMFALFAVAAATNMRGACDCECGSCPEPKIVVCGCPKPAMATPKVSKTGRATLAEPRE